MVMTSSSFMDMDAHDETCGICRMAFDGCFRDCKLPGDDCPLSCLQPCFPSSLHFEMGEFTDSLSAQFHVSQGMAERMIFSTDSKTVMDMLQDV
ncbi:uncharacterized protein [Rutidosis leptorrhynchoides]|uniref:uncharacterized protein isoform X5 n=1 Tax=Rutidosis leptorrhynchoides TaxID=125765 RepID=UPI003A998C40